ncbi:uncharacterized protein LOC133528004 isoform X2 [Cydia pomonella]|uniref:uncharacterized protein LOC133528004 isoform X2 n=1 Tax=Cydia pomonella TaxID=82600 RepID=UPI002ADD96D7|nr:uncharacterized protein LOC133528004 isoform X2 [Cydia pomonella]
MIEMKCKINILVLIYFAIASYSAVCAKTIRSMDQTKIHAPREWKLREGHKYWRTSKNHKRADINLMARQLHPKLMKMITSVKKPEDGGRYDNAKHRVISSQNNIRKNKLREGYTSFRPVGVRILPRTRTKYIARNKPEPAPSAMKGSQDRGGHMYGNLDNLGITYDKTNQRIMYSINRKNNPLLRNKKTKRQFSSGARKNNLEEAIPQFGDAHDLDELTSENSFPSDDIPADLKSENSLDGEQGVGHNEVSRNVEPFEDTPTSAASYPHTKEPLVYGNLDNLGITYGKTNQRVLYSQSRRNTILETLLRLLDQPSHTRDRSHKKPLVVVFYRNPRRKLKTINPFQQYYANVNQRDESSDDLGYLPGLTNTRRTNTNDSDSDDNFDTASSDFEFNVQNPYTVHKNRYLQNYVWNHKIYKTRFMTGDHINVNPYAPRFVTYGATAPELFYSRKWWYFNQDDFIPFG